MSAAEKARRNAQLMGILYGTIIGMEAEKVPLRYDQVERAMSPYCTPRELHEVSQELTRYASVVQRLLTER